MMRITIVIGLLSGALAAVGFGSIQLSADSTLPPANARFARKGEPDTVTQVSMRDVNFYLMPNSALRIRSLRGTMRSLKGGPVAFDDKNSFIIHLTYAEIGLNGTDINLPPPAIEGHITSIRVEGDQLVQTFGTTPEATTLPQPDTSAAAYMFFKGGTLHFGKLLMLDAEMQVVDLRPTGFFNFDLDKYKEQLVAGYERTLPDLGLEVYMLGIDKLSTGTASRAELPK
jgi:hypothetical protein